MMVPSFLTDVYASAAPVGDAKEGKLENRIKLTGLGDADSRFYIRTKKDVEFKWWWIPAFFTGIGTIYVVCKIIEKIHLSCCYIKINESNKTHFLNINSLQKRLKISHIDIKDKTNDEILGVLHLQVQKMTSPAFLNLTKRVQEIFLSKTAEILKNGAMVKDGEHLYVAQFNQRKALRVVKILEQAPTVATGTFSRIKHIEDVANGRLLAFKTPLRFDIFDRTHAAQRREELEDERQRTDRSILDAVMSDIEVRKKFMTDEDDLFGVQEIPDMLINIDIENGDKLFGSVEKLYESDLITWRNGVHSSLERLQCAKKVLQALMKWWEKGAPHSDIKPENLCIIEDKIRLIDLPLAESPQILFSPDYLSENDHIELFSPSRTSTFVQAGLRADVFAAGVTLFEILTLEFEMAFESALEYQFIPKNRPFNKIALEGAYSPALANILEKMVSHNPLARPTIEEMQSVVDIFQAEIERVGKVIG